MGGIRGPKFGLFCGVIYLAGLFAGHFAGFSPANCSAATSSREELTPKISGGKKLTPQFLFFFDHDSVPTTNSTPNEKAQKRPTINFEFE